jgi:hypothetical protein
MQVAFERVRERDVAVIEVAEIRAVNGLAREDASGNRGEHMAGVRERRGIRGVQRDNLVAAGRVRCNTEGATDLVGELSHSIEFSVALNLNPDENKVANSKSRA